MSVVTKHFVTFYSPGTFMAETSTREIEAWDTALALPMAFKVKERYDAVPYGFQFSTRTRGPDDLDSKESARSGMYYINGRKRTIAQVKARKFPKEDILISNMECNGWNEIVEKRPDAPGWNWCQPLLAGDVVLP